MKRVNEHIVVRRVTPLVLCLLAASCRAAAFESPFKLRVEPITATEQAIAFRVALTVPERHVIYAETFTVKSDTPATTLVPIEQPKPKRKPDPIDTARHVTVYDQDVASRWRLAPLRDGARLSIAYQGCDDTVCFMPETHRFRYDANTGQFVADTAEQAVPDQDTETAWDAGFTVFGGGGYMNTDAFLAFLDQAEGKTGTHAASHKGLTGFLRDPVAFFHDYGLVLTLILVLVGGVLLNLTPCVLPMIPINLAVIGAGAGTRGRGFFLGSAYGAGMVLVYGGLGWAILRSGLFFGALQASPWFSLAVALIFAVLALALFDRFVIDFTRFIPSKGGATHQGVLAAFSAGALSALLAGACVAPVVLAVLLLAGSLYAGGATGAQFLPFVLGVGMALPWPFAGAGLSVLPQPGMWMVRVKYAFGVLLALLAAYYLYLAVVGFLPGAQVARGDSMVAGDRKAWQEKITEAKQRGRPVFVDFWATWCKNCTVMEKTTFKDERVVARLANYVVVKVQAEKPDHAPVREMLQAFDIRGLPGFAVLTPPPPGARE